jgi:hypothetical protein
MKAEPPPHGPRLPKFNHQLCRAALALSAALMLAAAAIQAVYGIKAERQSLETLAAPLSLQELDRVQVCQKGGLGNNPNLIT